MKKNLTFRYTLHQMAYWGIAAGVVSFASAYLMQKGFAASTVGVLLAVGNLLSCGAQPFLADWADRAGGNILKKMILVLTALCGGCFVSVLMLPLEGWLFGLVYLLGIFCFDVMMPMMNAISVSYMNQGYTVNYGLSRGLGSLAYAVAALVIGKIMARFGADWMLLVSLGLMAAAVAVTLTYPGMAEVETAARVKKESCSVLVFFRRYKWYCASLLGVMLLGMFHCMTENYLIRIVEPLGGDSGSVGVALFVATGIETVVLVYFDKVRGKISDTWLLKLAGLSFLLKAVLFMLARNVVSIYAIQMLQATSYSFLAPTQLYYANARVSPRDMVKGQAFITAAYTLGCAAGNFAGGQLLSHFSVPVLLAAGVAMAAGGTAVLFATVDRKDVPAKA